MTAHSTIKPPMWVPGFNAGHPLANGLIGLWPFWEGVGNPNAMDVSGNGNPGTLTDMDPATDWVASNIGMSVDVSGADDYIALPATASLRPAHLSVFFYVKMSSGSFEYMVDTTSDNSGFGTTIQIQNAATLYWTIGAVRHDWPSSISVSAGQWHRIICTYNGVLMAVYIDGALANSVADSGNIAWDSNAIFLGLNHSSGQPFSGSYGLVGFWNRGLGVGEVADLDSDPWCLIRPPRAL